MWNDFTTGYRARFGEPNEDDNKVIILIKKQFRGESSTIRFEDIQYVKDYRAQNTENRAKGHYIYKSFKNMSDKNKQMAAEFRRKRDDLRKWDEQDSDGETTGEIASLKKEANKYRGGLEYLPASEGYPHGRFHKTSYYPGNLGNTSPVAFVDIDKPGEEMDDDEFNDALLRRGGKRTRRRRKKLKRKTKRRKKKKRKTKRKRIRRKRKKRKTKKIWKSL